MLREVFHLIIFIGNASPQEHTYLLRVVLTVQDIHDLLGIAATAGVGVDVVLAVPLVAVVVSLGSSQLDTTEGAALDVALHLQYPRDELGIGGTHADTPAGHVVTLRHGVELDAAVLGTRHLQDAEMLLAQDEGVRIVVHHHDVVATSHLHQTLVGGALRTTARRHVGIVRPQQPTLQRLTAQQFLQLVEVGLPAVVLLQIVIDDIGSQQFRERGVGGITRIGHQHRVAGIDERQRDMQDALLGTYQRQQLALVVEVNIVPTLVESCHRLTQFGSSLRGLIAVGIGLASHLTELLDGLLRRRHIGTSNGKADDVLTLGIQLCHLFQLTAEIVFLH